MVGWNAEWHGRVADGDISQAVNGSFIAVANNKRRKQARVDHEYLVRSLLTVW